MKRLLFIIIPIILAILIFILIFFIINRNTGQGALQVTSKPISKVYLDGKFIGQSPFCKCQGNDMVSAGAHTIRLVPISGNFEAFEEKITISPSILTVLDRTFGSSGSSQGSIISLSQISDKKDTQILVVSFPDKSQIFLDGNPSGSSPLLLKNLTVSDHEIKVVKDGYKEKILKIKTVQGYKLEALVYLGVNLETATSSALPSPVPSSSSTPTPVANVKVLILNTPTGFLRVRKDASLGAAQIGTVNPGEKYDFVSEKTGWFEIKLQNGQTGWVSSQYSQKGS